MKKSERLKTEKLKAELGTLQHRRQHVILSKGTREREDARITEIINQLREAA